MKKNIENSDAPTRSPTMLAPVSVRRRKIRNGISGACERRSIAMKAAISAADRPIKPSVCSEPQPALVASPIAYTRTERPAVTVTAPAASQQVGHSPAEQQEAAEGEHVRVHDPGEVRLREVEPLTNRREGDVDNR